LGRWDDQFESHRVFPALANARQQFDEISGVEDPDQQENPSRLGHVLDHLDASLRGSDPELVQIAVLEQMANTLDQITTHLQQFAATPDAGFLVNANAQADSALSQALQLTPRLSEQGEPPDYQSAITSFRRSAGQHLRAVESEVGSVRQQARQVADQLNDQQAKITEQNTRLDNVVAQFQQQFSDAQAQRQAEQSQAFDEAKVQLRATLDQAEQNTAATVGEAQTQLSELLGETRTAGEEALVDIKMRADNQHADLENRSEDRINQLDALLEKAIATVGVIGSTGMAGGYQIVANTEKKAADFWRWVAALALLGAILATIFAVAHGVSHGFEVDTFFAKWAISVPFAALAAYAARESSKHREQARINRQIELQLASLDAYLVTLPDERQNEIRSKLADRFFGELRPGEEHAAPEEGG
jgi:hypothetical protein